MLNSTMIKAKVLQHSITTTGDIIQSFEMDYQRFIHSEFLTHRVFSRNSASSRAIPVAKMVSLLDTQLAHPIHWGQNQAGMQAAVELEGEARQATQDDWVRGSQYAGYIAKRMVDHGAHKQIANRVLEPYVHMKTVMTTTELINFKELRNHPDAQPEFKALAEAMEAALAESTPLELRVGELHVPYVDREVVGKGKNRKIIYSVNGIEVTPEQALKLSASACAQVSYRVLNMGLGKALGIYDRLVSSVPIHASPFEHQASPMGKIKGINFPMGVTHLDRNGAYWSGNFKGWVQNRQVLEQQL